MLIFFRMQSTHCVPSGKASVQRSPSHLTFLASLSPARKRREVLYSTVRPLEQGAWVVAVHAAETPRRRDGVRRKERWQQRESCTWPENEEMAEASSNDGFVRFSYVIVRYGRNSTSNDCGT